MDSDPYFWSQNNGGGAPVHFATTYKQLDMVRRAAEKTCAPLPSSPARATTPVYRSAPACLEA
jgi:[acyl-carrier-protein] S-malonyltransferase